MPDSSDNAVLVLRVHLWERAQSSCLVHLSLDAEEQQQNTLSNIVKHSPCIHVSIGQRPRTLF